MSSSPACFAEFTRILAAEYSTPLLRGIHRLTVDTYAVQHPGDGRDRRQIQSVGLHLARLYIQLTYPLPPRETNDVMLGLARHKATLVGLRPPNRFTLTAADIAPFSGGCQHADKVRVWAAETWRDWSEHHEYIRHWVAGKYDARSRSKLDTTY
ncbi:DUF5946 family protein [Pelagerythrobacter marinus]|uniref:DUF5946 family protein n=1 Tax=Pelagerythrobacter marinus TaxID=538382 RepID=UPI00389A58ED